MINLNEIETNQHLADFIYESPKKIKKDLIEKVILELDTNLQHFNKNGVSNLYKILLLLGKPGLINKFIKKTHVRKFGEQTLIFEKREFLKKKITSRLNNNLAEDSKPRVAICVSGQLRGFVKAWATWRDAIDGLKERIDFDVYVYSSVNLGRRLPPTPEYCHRLFASGDFSNCFSKVLEEFGNVFVSDRYKEIYDLLYKTSDVDESYVKEVFGTENVFLEKFFDKNISGQMHMLNKIYNCHSMALHREYDLVMKVRPDRPLIEGFSYDNIMKMIEESKKSLVLFLFRGNILRGKGIDSADQFAAGVPDVMDIYAASARFENLSREDPNLGFFSIGQSIFKSGLCVKKIPFKFGPILDVPYVSFGEVKESLEFRIKMYGVDSYSYLDEMLLSAVNSDIEALNNKKAAS